MILMAKRRNWFSWLKTLFGQDTKSKPDKTVGRIFLFGRLNSRKNHPKLTASSTNIERTSSQVEEEQSKHALAVAIATTVAAEAAVAAAQAAAEVVRLTGSRVWQRPSDIRSCEMAATKIQSAFRGYLARKALRALKALVKLQAMVRGRAVRRQTRSTFNSLQSLMKIQARVHNMRIKVAENSKTLEEKRKVNKQIKGATQTKDRRNSQISTKLRTREPQPKCNNLNSRWSWLEQWVDSQPWRRYEQEEELLLAPDQVKHKCQIRVSDVPVCSDSKCMDKMEEPGRPRSPSSLPRKSFHLSKTPSIRDKEFLSGSPAAPSYMVSTESAKAKARSISTPRQRMGSVDSGSEHNSPSKKTSKTHGWSQQSSPRLKGLSPPIKSSKSWKDLSVDSECSLQKPDQPTPFW